MGGARISGHDQDPDPYGVPIEDLGLPVNVYRCLRHHAVVTVGHILDVEKEDLLDFFDALDQTHEATYEILQVDVSGVPSGTAKRRNVRRRSLRMYERLRASLSEAGFPPPSDDSSTGSD
jgi:DNA-directed RNA polymerase alpha subunit